MILYAWFWDYILNRELFITADNEYTWIYAGFGLAIIVFALVGFIAHSD
jgi:hypothetical protein